MRILVLNYEFPPLGGGASHVSYEITKEYTEAGHTVDVVTMGFKGLSKMEVINDRFYIYRVSCLRSKREICHPWEQLTYLVSAYFKCKELLKKNNYDVCHAYFIIPTGVLALKLKKKFGLKYIITSQGADVLGYDPRFKFLYPLLKKYWIKIIDNSNWVVVPTAFLKNKIFLNHITSNIKIIPNGISSNKFNYLKKENLILSVGRLNVNKGIHDFIEAIKDIDLSNWSVVIVGDGTYRKHIENLVKKYNLDVTFTGWIDNSSEELKKLYGRASIFISPSYFESFGLSVVEAMQAGVTPLISNIEAHRSLIDRKELFFEVHNPSDLRNKLEALMKSERVYDLRRMVKERFDISVIGKKYINLL